MAQKTIVLLYIFALVFPCQIDASGFETETSNSSVNLFLSTQSSQNTVQRTIVKSLLLPGLGEFSMGENRRGRFFVRSELGFWLILAGSLWSASSDDSRLRVYAIQYAGADLSGKDDRFFVNMSTYESMDTYNAYQQRARSPYDTYSTAAGYYWSWVSENHRQKYRDFLIRRDQAKSVASFSLAGMILNRIVSAIDVVSLNRKGLFEANVQQTPEGAELKLIFCF
ncbi:MAG: hypothetical protein ACE5EE_00275 [Fidelibacterota bacterium]